MATLADVHGRSVRLTEERREHLETNHPEMAGQIPRIAQTLADPDVIIRSGVGQDTELFYRLYEQTPVTRKHLCVVVKSVANDNFIVTAYYTDRIKRGETLWAKE